MGDYVIPATFDEVVRYRERLENGTGPKWAAVHNAYTEKGKLRYGIEQGIPLNIPQFLYGERRVMLLDLEQRYRERGSSILAQWTREEIDRHDQRFGIA